MRHLITTILLVTVVMTANAQSPSPFLNLPKKGSIYFYWGWNRALFNDSDISFRGPDYNFKLSHVTAKDAPSPLKPTIYFNITKFSIPQYNFRFGYYLNSAYSLSFGVDHMKYVVTENQTAQISGSIHNTETIYDGEYNHDDIVLAEEFLLFEHTDGLNYPHLEIRRHDNLLSKGKLNLNIIEGLGAGVLIPKTNATLLNHMRHDMFHVAGYGCNATLGAQLTFLNMFFIQTELRGGYINLPDIRTTDSKQDKAAQHFYFVQTNLVFGGIVRFGG